MRKILQTLTLGLSIIFSQNMQAQYVVDFEDGSKPSYASADVTLNAIDWNMTEANIGSLANDYFIDTQAARLRGYETSSMTMLADKTGGIGNVSFTYRGYGSDSQVDWKVEYSIDAGLSWTQAGTTFTATTADTTTFNAPVNASTDARIRIVRATADGNSSNRRLNIDNIILTDFGTAVTIDTIASISTADMSVIENVGTVDVTVTLNQSATSDKTVDLILNSGNAAIVNNYTTQTITFTGGSTSETVTLTVTPGQLASASETLEFELSNKDAGLEYGTDILFDLTVNEMPVAAAPCSDLFFSEYIEGSSNNKALEIYNPTTGIIDLSNYEVRKYNNGSATATNVISLTGLLLPGDVFVLANGSSDQAILDETDLISGTISHNGNDAYDLYNIALGDSIDIIGELGVDMTWTVGSGSTANNTLIRMATIGAGTTIWTGVGETQWDVLTQDDFTNIGMHTNTSCTDPIPLTAYPTASSMEVCIGETITFSHNSFGGTSPYNAGWEVESVQTFADDLVYTATTAGTITINFGVMDASSAADDSVFTIKVNALPTTGVTFDNTVCAMDTANFATTASGVSSILTYGYSLTPSGELSDSINGNGFVVPDTDGSFILTQMVTDSLGCVALEDFIITSNVLEDATFAGLSNICDDETITLTSTNTTGIWSGSIVTDLGSGNGTAQGAAGVYDVTFTTTGACPDAHTESVEIYATPTAAFTFTGNIDVDFTNTSTGGATCSWDLGDGATSTDCSPSHTYATDGTYTVCLTTTSADGCEDTDCQTITIQGVGVTENNANIFSMYPNPTEGLVTITTQANSTIQLINIVGEVVFTSNIVKTAELDFSNFSKGSYFVKVIANGKIETKKLIIQ